MKMYRQGDVLLIQISKLPDDAVEDITPSERIVLAYGEVTGHAHAINSHYATLYNTKEETFLETTLGAELRHEEHGPIALPPGYYRVLKQVEYTPIIPRRVAD
jgi:hypothetical protein